jgi:tetratricopeptide (TPR) repeat protein
MPLDRRRSTLHVQAPALCWSFENKQKLQGETMNRVQTFLLALICVAAATAMSLAGQSNGGPTSADTVAESPPAPKVSVDIGNFYLHKKAYRGALSRFREAVRDDPDYAPGYLGLGEVYERLGRKREALAAYKTYLNKLPSERDAEKARGAHKAIKRLKRELASRHGTQPPRASSQQ